MSKTLSSKQPEDFNLKSENILIRRPIRNGLEQEKVLGKKCVNVKDLPASKRLYPNLEEFDTDPEEDENSKLFGKSTEARSQKCQQKESSNKNKAKKTEYAKESQSSVKKSNDSPKVHKLSDSPISYTLNKYLYVFILVIIAISILVFYNSSGPSVGRREINLKETLDSMKNRFPNQNILTYRILQKALEKVFNTTQEPSAPAIVTIIVNKNAKDIASEFSLHLAKALAPQNYVLINEIDYWKEGTDLLKLKIDEEIQSKMDRNGFNVVIVDNLQNIPYEAAMIFHGYCDHELAPIKRAAFLFIVPLNEILPENAPFKMIDRIAMQRLKNIWHTASSDIIDSLIVRLTVNVINIRL